MSSDAFSSRSGGADARPTFEYIPSNSADRRSNASSATALMVRWGWSFGTRSFRSTNAGIVACESRLTLMETTSSSTAWSYPSSQTTRQPPVYPTFQPGSSRL